MRAAVAVAATLLMVSGCAAPAPEVFPSPAPSLAARPSALAGDAPAPDASVDESLPPTDPASAEAATETSDGPAPTDPVSAETEPEETGAPLRTAAFTTIARIDDPAGDVGPEGPDWADLVRLVLEDNGATLRVTIDFAGTLPTVLGEDEVVGIGVDLLREDDGESRYQLFVDGGSDGWYAYFQRQDGFMAFPGTFSLGDTRIVLTIPAEVIGNPVEGEWRSFLDWSGEGLVLRPVAHDRAPEEGWHVFRR